MTEQRYVNPCRRCKFMGRNGEHDVYWHDGRDREIQHVLLYWQASIESDNHVTLWDESYGFMPEDIPDWAWDISEELTALLMAIKLGVLPPEEELTSDDS